MLSKVEIFQKLDTLLNNWKASHYLEFLDEVEMKRVVRRGRIVRKVKVKRPGFKVIRQGSIVRFVRMTPQEKRLRRIAARRSWRIGRAARRARARRTLMRSKVQMRLLYKNKE